MRNIIRAVMTMATAAVAVVILGGTAFAVTPPKFPLVEHLNCFSVDVKSGTSLVANIDVCNVPAGVNSPAGIQIDAADDACDNYYLSFHTWDRSHHVITYNTKGCWQNENPDQMQLIPWSQIGSPDQWWLTWAGYNSPSPGFAFPPT